MRRIALHVSLALLVAGCRARSEPRGNAPGSAHPGELPVLGFGRSATADEIKAWDIAIAPDGAGLPPGSGTAAQGAVLYRQKCAMCHGATGTEGPAEKLVGREPRQGFPFGRDPSLVRTIGNYWPYATALYDYIHRAMPLNAPGSLEPDDVYGAVAWLLWRNEVIPDTLVVNAQTLPRIVMPAHDRFVVDNRRGGAEIR
ncbi:MAG TPA: c-type cytochrome [Gemmatimonadales bacterium]